MDKIIGYALFNPSDKIRIAGLVLLALLHSTEGQAGVCSVMAACQVSWADGHLQGSGPALPLCSLRPVLTIVC